MQSLNPLTLWRSFLALPNASPPKTLGVAFLVALACSVLVSLTAVTLKPLREANFLNESASAMVQLIETLGYELPQKHYVERASGAYVDRASSSQTMLSPDQDLAGLVLVNNVVTVYEVRTDGRLDLVVLPVRGVGYKSMMKGYLALESDLKTIAALTFHQQDETPGMGARIMEADWQAQWARKQTTDESGEIRIQAVKGKSKGPYEVDGISGATSTVTGVTNLVRFWLGPNGYGPYLALLKREAGS